MGEEKGPECKKPEQRRQESNLCRPKKRKRKEKWKKDKKLEKLFSYFHLVSLFKKSNKGEILRTESSGRNGRQR